MKWGELTIRYLQICCSQKTLLIPICPAYYPVIEGKAYDYSDRNKTAEV